MQEPLRIGIGGGKGGVGKSVVAANLACAMGELGMRVVLVDADLGAANLHTLFGINRPGKTIQALVDKEVTSLEEVVVETDFKHVALVPGSGAVVGAANVGHAQKLKLIRHIQALTGDVIIVDCGAGSSFNVVDLFSATDIKLLVATPQLTSLQNAYGFLKSAVYRSLRSRVQNPSDRELLSSSSDRSETERMRDLMHGIAKHDFALAEELARVVDTFAVRIVGNQLESSKQQGVIHALARMMTDFLAIEAPVATTIPLSGAIHRSVTARAPFYYARSAAPEGQAIRTLAQTILETDLSNLRSERESERPVPGSGSVPPGTKPGTLPGLLSEYLRRHARINVSWDGSIEGPMGAVPCTVSDVSCGGASLTTAVPNETGLVVGTPVRLNIHLAAGSYAIEATLKNAEERRLGVAFTGTDAESLGSELVEVAKALQAA